MFALASPCTAQPDNYPNRPVRLIVPFAPGGPTDTVARVMGEQLQRQWKQPVVIDYKPGAGTVVGTQLVARAPADGYTLGMAISALMINPALRSDLPYDTVREVAAVSLIGQAHFGLFAHPSTPFSSVAELIAYARSRPDALSYATPGTGTGTHLAGEMLGHLAGIKMLHVPYKGSAPAQVDVAGGRVPLLFDVLFSAMPMVRDGRLKMLALASPQRARSAPEIALIAETLPGFSAMSLIGIIGPAGMPTALLDRISADLGEAVRAPAVTERMNQLGMEPVGSTHAEYSRIVREEIGKWTQVVKTAQIKLD
ncbi:MAG: tripartite tricarboxylate transporter substrate binding protein [Betaproteobacteria bacterium]|nr:tripartite tricarboxylate transporter substrate binding protein [Betaproteobacteria bacterium]